MKPLAPLLLCSLSLLSGCATQVWYQPDKTPAETQAAYGHALLNATKATDRQGARFASDPLMLLAQDNGRTKDRRRIVDAIMLGQGFKLVPAATVPNARDYPKP